MKGIICRLSPPRRPSHHSVQRHVRIPCMVGIWQRTEQRQDRSAYKPMKRRDFLHPEHPSGDGIAAKADESLSHAICMNPSHVLSSFLPRPKQHQYHMGTRPTTSHYHLKTIGTFIQKPLSKDILSTFIPLLVGAYCHCRHHHLGLPLY